MACFARSHRQFGGQERDEGLRSSSDISRLFCAGQLFGADEVGLDFSGFFNWLRTMGIPNEGCKTLRKDSVPLPFRQREYAKLVREAQDSFYRCVFGGIAFYTDRLSDSGKKALAAVPRLPNLQSARRSTRLKSAGFRAGNQQTPG